MSNLHSVTRHELRCPFCVKHPLLAYYGVDDRGKAYVHQKVYKSGRVFAESVVYGGTVSLMCRECRRWHQIVIQDQSQVRMTQTQMPRVLREEADPPRSLPNDPPSS